MWMAYMTSFFILRASSSMTPNIRITKQEGDVIYEYVVDQGKEYLRVYGEIPDSFNREQKLEQFRSSSNNNDPSFIVEPEVIGKTPQTKTLLESLSDLLIGTKWGSNVYSTLVRNELTDQLKLAQEELNTVNDDLSKIYTQELILRNRQAELGEYLQENLRKPVDQRNPTIEELVSTEDDRLALLEHRLRRLKTKLLSQKTELEKYIMNVQHTAFREQIKARHSSSEDESEIETER